MFGNFFNINLFKIHYYITDADLGRLSISLLGDYRVAHRIVEIARE